jgi:hypothetical protein
MVLKMSPTRPSSLQPSLTTFAKSNFAIYQRPGVTSRMDKVACSRGVRCKDFLEISKLPGSEPCAETAPSHHTGEIPIYRIKGGEEGPGLESQIIPA